MLTGYELSPQFTLVTGFIGPNRLVMMLIKVGGEYVTSSPYPPIFAA